MGRHLAFVARQATLIGLAALAYFGVRGLTESNEAVAVRNAEWVLQFERWIGLDIELDVQELTNRSGVLVDLANWIYIWGHWPVIIATLTTLAVVKRPAFFELRNAMFLSGAIGLVIFALFAVAPPRLFDPEYVDTVTQRSNSYRVFQPPGLVNKYAAIPSLHFGWNLLVGWMWMKTTGGRLGRVAGVVMPIAMAFAVVATANHWVLDVVIGGLVAVAGLVLERFRADRLTTGRRGLSPRLWGPTGGSMAERAQPLTIRDETGRSPPAG